MASCDLHSITARGPYKFNGGRELEGCRHSPHNTCDTSDMVRDVTTLQLVADCHRISMKQQIAKSSRLSTMYNQVDRMYSCNLEWKTPTTIPNIHCWLHMILHVKWSIHQHLGWSLTSAGQSRRCCSSPKTLVISMQASIVAQSCLSMVSLPVCTYGVAGSLKSYGNQQQNAKSLQSTESIDLIELLLIEWLVLSMVEDSDYHPKYTLLAPYDFACKMINSSTSGMAVIVCHTKSRQCCNSLPKHMWFLCRQVLLHNLVSPWYPCGYVYKGWAIAMTFHIVASLKSYGNQQQDAKSSCSIIYQQQQGIDSIPSNESFDWLVLPPVMDDSDDHPKWYIVGSIWCCM
jgi:hypothetical protein